MKHLLTLFLSCAAILAIAGNHRDIEARIIPVPQKIEVVSRDVYKLADTTKFKVETTLPETQVRDFIREIASRFWGIAPEVVVVSKKIDVPADGYRLDTTTPEFVIEVSDLAGLRYAFSTMRQLAETERGVARGTGWGMPQVKIDDFPQLKFRGFHYCFLENDDLIKLERAIRFAAYCKYNFFVLEMPYRIKLESMPGWHLPNAYSKEDIRRLVKLGKSLGITLIPCTALYGHCDSFGGCHPGLEEHPEYAPLLEPTGYSWCLSNPNTRPCIEKIVLELYELFDQPPYFHIGCDEAYNAGTCSLCAKSGEHWKKVADHITHLHDFLAKHNCRTMIWHDMLFKKGDPAWKGSEANGDDNSVKLRAALPRDVIVCYWEYRFADHEYRAGKEGVMGFPIFDVLRQEGFDAVACGWMYDTTPALGEKSLANGGLGILQTTWNTLSGTQNYHTMFAVGSTSGWNPKARYPQMIVPYISTLDITAYLLRQISRDMDLHYPRTTTK